MTATEDFAIVIGISRYPNLKDLEGPVKDAERFRDWLIQVAKVPNLQVKLVISKDPPDSGDRPIKDEIDDVFTEIFDLGRKLRMRSKQARRLYLYFAGHGCAQEFRHVALLMANASLDNLDRSLDAASYHERLAGRALFPEQVIFYDCCRNWDRRVTGQGPGWTKEDPTSNAASVTQFILYAAGFTEYANERALKYSTRRGLFTEALIEGLNGRAVKKVQGEWVVSTDTLVPYVETRLEQLTEGEKVRQQLNINWAGLPRQLVLAKVAHPPLYPLSVDTSFPGINVVIYDHKLQEFHRRLLSGNRAEFHLPPGLYRISVEPDGPQELVEVGPGKPSSITL